MTASTLPLEGTVALVTGAGSGIGRAGALAFAELGAAVMAADLDLQTAEETAALASDTGVGAAAVECDVTDEDQVTAMIGACIAELGGLHAAFNNVGNGAGNHQIHETPIEQWRWSLDVNLTGTFLCAKHELIHMTSVGGGCIVNTASGAARVPAPGNAAYSAAKRGVVALTAHIANDYGRSGVRANAVLPGMIDTPGLRANMDDDTITQIGAFMPAGIGEPRDIGGVAAWLCTDAARFVNGQALVVDGGAILA